uniref:Polysaccharide chain length determinant N-terminal domain-containing protein n=1 Tax=Caldisericum exile TaxID=693075 RepID=A0A7C4U3E7_9BACT
MEEEEVELRDYINVLVKRKRLVIVITLIAVLISGLLSYFVLPKVYESTASFIVANPNIGTSTPATTFEQATNPITFMSNPSIATYSELVKSPSFLAKIISENGFSKDLTPEILSKSITVTNPKDSNLIIVHIDLSDPEQSYKVAKAIADEFPKYAQELNKVDVSSLVSFIEAQIQDAEKDLEAKEKVYKDSLSTFTSDILTKSKELLQGKESLYLSEASKLATDELNLALTNVLKATNEYQAFLAQEDNITVLTKKIEVKLSEFSQYQDTLSQLQISIETTHAKLADLTKQIAKESQFITLTQSVADSPFLTQLVSDNPNFKELIHLQMESTQLNPLYQQLSSQISTLQATLTEITQKQTSTQKISDQNLKEIYALQKQLAEKQVTLEKLQRNLDLSKDDYSKALTHYQDLSTMLSLNTGGLLTTVPSLKARQEELIALKRDLDEAQANYNIAFSIYNDNSKLQNIDIGGLISLDPTLRDGQLKYLSMKRELDLAQNKYNLLKQSYNEAKILGTMNMQNLKLALDPVMPEKPVKPNKKLNIAIAGVAALFFSILLAFFLEYMQGTQDSKKEAKA